MKNKYKDNYKKECEIAERRLEKTTENIVIPQLEIPDMTKALDNFVLMNNALNSIPNSLIPIIEMTNRYNKIIDDVTKAYQSLNPIEIFIKTMPPIDLIERISLTQSTLQQIHNSFNLIDWTALNITLNKILLSISTFPFDLIITDKEIHAKLLYQYVCEVNDEELISVFTYDFILRIIKEDWWIIPTFDLEYYKKISKNMEGSLNQSFLNEFYDDPNLIKEMVLNWNITSDLRRTIINQALFNYIEGHYEICVLTLVLQIEGIMKEKINYNKSSGKLRASLEQKLIEKTTNDPWNRFLNKCNIEYIWNVLYPIDDEINFKEDIGIVNRNEIAHMGIVEADQLIAMRLFFIIDTLIYIFESV